MNTQGELKMDNTPEEFIYYCYNWILGRNPDPDGKEHYIKLLNAGVSKHEILISFLNSDEYAERRNSLMNPTI